MTTTGDILKLVNDYAACIPKIEQPYKVQLAVRMYEELRTAIEALVRERDAALADAVDAERYRWLRDDCPWVLCGTPGGPISRLVHRLPITYQVVEDVPDEMDAAIDAARGEKT
jgi:hypothetical protein